MFSPAPEPFKKNVETSPHQEDNFDIMLFRAPDHDSELVKLTVPNFIEPHEVELFTASNNELTSRDYLKWGGELLVCGSIVGGIAGTFLYFTGALTIEAISVAAASDNSALTKVLNVALCAVSFVPALTLGSVGILCSQSLIRYGFGHVLPKAWGKYKSE